MSLGIFNSITRRGASLISLRSPYEGEFVLEIPSSELVSFNNTPYLYEYRAGILSKISIEDYQEEIKIRKVVEIWERIKIERDRRKDGGFKVNGWWFHSDQPSRVQHLGLVMLGPSLPADIMWKTMDGTFVPLTPAIVTQIFQSGLLLDTSLFAKAEEHKVAMESSSDPEAYDYHTGWPENFLGL